MAKIVILDGDTVFKSPSDFDELCKMGEVSYYPNTSPDLIPLRIGDAEIVLTNKCVIDRSVIDCCSNLKYVSVLATGYNIIDVAYAYSKGIKVSNVPDYCTDSVVQHTLALLLELCSKVGEYNESVHSGEWANKKNFSYILNPITELSGKIFGIIGYGNIGKKVALAVQSLGMKVLYYRRTSSDGCVPLNYLLANSDIVSLHCPLNADSEKLINESALRKMKPTALLINTSRGGLIDENALKYALDNGIIAGAAVDVLSSEPPKKDNPLVACNKCLITPHVAWATKEALSRLIKETELNVMEFLNGGQRNPVFK